MVNDEEGKATGAYLSELGGRALLDVQVYFPHPASSGKKSVGRFFGNIWCDPLLNILFEKSVPFALVL